LPHQDAKRAARPLKPLNMPFPIDRQKALGLAVMEALGFDFEHGRLDVSTHPFCGGVPTDVRMTTRYTESEFLSSLMGIIHETGHGLYEQGLPKEWGHLAVGKARGMAIHESQSLFVEKQIGRSSEFWDWAMPLVAEHPDRRPSAAGTWTTFWPTCTKCGPALIRVDADEATYPSNVILPLRNREGSHRRHDQCPKTCPRNGYRPHDRVSRPRNARQLQGRPHAGLSTGQAALSVISRATTLGAMIAAQLWSALEKDHPSARDDMRHGRFVEIQRLASEEDLE
jgi:carboxypeptidase Taq